MVLTLSPVQYFGGPVIPNVAVNTIYYGSEWSTDQELNGVPGQLNNFFKYITDSSWMNIMNQYSVIGSTPIVAGNGAPTTATPMTIGDGSFAEQDPTNPSIPTGTTYIYGGHSYQSVSDTQIQAMVASEIAAGNVNPIDQNQLYFVFTPPQVVVTASFGDSVTTFSGYHSSFTDGTKNVLYAVIPVPGIGDPAPDGPYSFDGLTVSASHELAESITDPLVGFLPDDAPGYEYPCAWASNSSAYTAGGEIADIGDYSQPDGGQLGNYYVSYLMSNDTDSVVLQKSLPISVTSIVALTGPDGSSVQMAIHDSDATTNITGTFCFGDGTTTTGVDVTDLGSGNFVLTVDHTYSTTGTETFSYEVDDSDGGQILGNQSISIGANQNINFQLANSMISFAPNETADLTATGGASGNPVTFSLDSSSTGQGSINGNVLTIDSTGTFVIDANQAGGGSFYPAQQVQQALTVTPASLVPSYSNLDAPAITYGTATDTISGTLSYVPPSGPAQIPTGDVNVTVDGVTLQAPIDPATGNFSAVFDTQELPANTSGYTVTYDYPGDSTFSSPPDDSSQVLVVNPALLTVTALNETSVAGYSPAPFQVGYSGFVPGEDPSVLGGTLVFTTQPTNISSQGTYEIIPSGLTSSNDAIQFDQGTLTVLSSAPAPLTLTPLPNQSTSEGAGVTLGATAAAGGVSLTYTATGLPQGLSIDPDTGVITGTVAAGDALAAPGVNLHSLPYPDVFGYVGYYPVTVTATDGPNTLSTTFNWGIYDLVSVEGEHYDVNNNATDGAELTDSPQGNHTESFAYNLGTANQEQAASFQGVIDSDARVHQGPAIIGFDSTTGSAPDWYVVNSGSSLFQQDQVIARISTYGGSDLSLYRLTVITNQSTFSTIVSGDGTATITAANGSDNDNTNIYFEIQKLSGTNFLESVGYTVTYEVHDFGPLPTDPTFTSTVVTASTNAVFAGQSITFTAQVNNDSTGNTVLTTGTVQFQINGSNVGQPVAVNSSGEASISTTAFSVGLNTIDAIYTSGSNSIQGSSGELDGAVTVTSVAIIPSYSNLDVPAISYGTGTDTVSGTLSYVPSPGASAEIPTGSVNVTVNGVTMQAPIDPTTGDFSAIFDTQDLPANTSGYTVTFDYAGDSIFSSPPDDTSLALVVNPALLTITANNDSKSYGMLKTFSATAFMESGLVTANGDSITGVTENSDGAPVTATARAPQ